MNSDSDRTLELLKAQAELDMEREKEIALNPLSEYSTTQLKRELRRRKKSRR